MWSTIMRSLADALRESARQHLTTRFVRSPTFQTFALQPEIFLRQLLREAQQDLVKAKILRLSPRSPPK